MTISEDAVPVFGKDSWCSISFCMSAIGGLDGPFS